jgi:hypothetical protein
MITMSRWLTEAAEGALREQGITEVSHLQQPIQIRRDNAGLYLMTVEHCRQYDASVLGSIALGSERVAVGFIPKPLFAALASQA